MHESDGYSDLNIATHLIDLIFPATKSQIIFIAAEGSGEDTGAVLDISEKVPDKIYHSMEEILSEANKVRKLLKFA